MPDDGEPFGWLIVENASSEERRATSRVEQLVEAHHDSAKQIARTLAHRLGLPEAYTQALAVAARLHDEGKRTWRWQRAFNARRDGTYAKTRGPINFKLLDGYRHEFGSLPAAASDLEFTGLPLDLQDLVLHLRGGDGDSLRRYVFGLSLVAATEPLDAFLRQGCLLVPDPAHPAVWEVVARNGARTSVHLGSKQVVAYAEKMATSFGVGESQTVAFEKARAKADVKKADKKAGK